MQTRHLLLLAGLALPAAVFAKGSPSRPRAPGGPKNPNGGYTPAFTATGPLVAINCTGYGCITPSDKQLMP